MAVDRTSLRRRHEERVRILVPPSLEELQDLQIFQRIAAAARPKVIDKARRYMHLVDAAAGDEILREGAYNDSAFYVVEGEVEVLLAGEARSLTAGPERNRARAVKRFGSTRPLSQVGDVVLRGLAETPAAERVLLAAGEIIGEMSALSRYAVTATVRATSRTRLLQIKLPGLRLLLAASRDFRAYMDERYRERALGGLLRRVGLFAGADETVIEWLRREAQLVAFKPGQLIEEEGAPADAFYIVRGGVLKLSALSGTSELALTYLRTGEYLGEGVILEGQPWPYRIEALDHVEAVKIAASVLRTVFEKAPHAHDAMWQGSLQRLAARGAVLENPISSRYVQMAMDTGLIHGESVLLIDLTRCTHCDECVRGCAEAHGGTPRFIREGSTYRSWLIPAACYQCTDPVCMIDCPTGAITRDLGTLEVTINGPEHPARPCIGCGNCAKRCPWGNIVVVESGQARSDGKQVEYATKCDLCSGRPQGPACVQMCPQACAIRVSFKDIPTVARTFA